MLDRIIRSHGIARGVLGGVATLLLLHIVLAVAAAVLCARGDPSLLIA
jgi:hypothetical protein